MNPNGVLIRVVDDDESFRTAIARFLRATGFAVKAYASAAEFLSDSEKGIPGCVLLDLEMPQVSGLDLQDALKKADHPLPVVFLSGHRDIPKTVLAMRRGAEDFLTKSCSKENLLEAIHRAISRDDAERKRRAQRDELRAKFEALTEREREVLQQVVAGKLNKQIAADLDISERTVKFHRNHITAKLDVKSVAELTRFWEAVSRNAPSPSPMK